MRPLLNYSLFLQDSARYLDLYSDGPASLAAAFDIAPRLLSLSLVEDCAERRESFAPLTRRAHTKRRTKFGRVERTLAAITGETFDRIRIADVAGFTQMRAALFDAFRLADDDTLILVDRCERPDLVDAVFQALAGSLLEPAMLPGWRHNVGQMLLRRHRVGRVEKIRKTILVSIVGEQTQAEWRISRASIAAYAARIGADLVLFDEELTDEQRPLCKLIALEKVRGRGRVLVLDTDMVVRDDCPDLFAITPDDAVALFCESFHADRSSDMQRLREAYGIELAEDCYANTGLMLLTEAAVDRLAISGADTTIYLGPRYEQDYVNAVLQKDGFPVVSLSALVNCIILLTPDLADSAFLLHFAGGDARNGHLTTLVETVEPRTGRLVRLRSNLPMTILRPVSLRNAARATAGRTDLLLAAHQMRAPDSTLVMSENITRFDCPQVEWFVVYGPYLPLEAGKYEVDFLFDLESYKTALETSEPLDAGPELGSVTVDIVGGSGERTIVKHRGPLTTRSLTITFDLAESIGDFECRLLAPSRPFSFYGVRIRSLETEEHDSNMVTFELVGKQSVADACHRALDFRRENRLPGRPHPLPKPLIVSLTSHGPRFHALADALDCLLHQTMRADEIVLWIEADDRALLPAEVERLQAEGLTIRLTDGIGPYSKIVPAVEAFPDAFILIADDDKYYSRDWLATLAEAWIPDERALLCHRAHRMLFDEAGMPLPYLDWDQEIEKPGAADDLFATGCGGILFPPGLLPPDAWDRETFRLLCPTADDIWINCMARRYDCAIRKVGGLFHVPDLPRTQDVALAHHNRGGANDKQLRAVLERYGLDLMAPS